VNAEISKCTVEIAFQELAHPSSPNVQLGGIFCEANSNAAFTVKHGKGGGWMHGRREGVPGGQLLS